MISQPPGHDGKVRRRAAQPRPVRQNIPKQLAEPQNQAAFTQWLFHPLPVYLGGFAFSVPFHRQMEQSSKLDDAYSPSG